MFSPFKPKCPRCEARNEKTAEFCSSCGIAMASPRPAILKGNRWEAAPDEFAVFFTGRDLKGLFSKTLYIPAEMRAWILQGSRTEDLQQGEYTLQTLPERINAMFSDRHAEILITRATALPIPFVFDDIPSAELLAITVETSIAVRIGDPAAFRSQVMLTPGTICVPQLERILRGHVRQIIVETLGGRSLRDLSDHGKLRQELNQALPSGLQHRLNALGLAFDQADTLSIRHDRFDTNQQLKGSLWLEVDEARRKAEHRTELAELYSQDEWAKIAARKEDLQRRRWHADLNAEEAEIAQSMRDREIEALKKITEAKTKEEAVKWGARDAIEALEHDYLRKQQTRAQDTLKSQWCAEDDETAWRRTQELARIRHEAEVRVAEMQRAEAEKLERKRTENQLERIRVEGEIERARLIDDKAERKRQLDAANEKLAKATIRDHALLNEQSELALDQLRIERESRRRETDRIQAWGDKVMEEKLAEVDARIAEKKAKTSQGTINGMLAQTEEYALRKARDADEEAKRAIERKRKEQEVADEAADRALDRQIKLKKEERAATLEDNAHEIERLRTLGVLTPEALIAISNNPGNTAAILDLAKTKALIDATPEQIAEIVGQLHRNDGAEQNTASAAGPAGQHSATEKPDQMSTKELLEFFARQSELAQENLVRVSGHGRDASIGVAQGYAMRETAAPQSSTPFSEPLSLKACPRCNFSNLSNARACGNCKTDF